MATTQQGPDTPPAVGVRVGRREEVGQARRLLTSVPLVTLTGVGGVGKTVVALGVVAASRGPFADGVTLVELATVTDPDRVAATVLAAVTGSSPGPASPGRDRSVRLLVDRLADRQVLLVLDTCEHLVGAVAALVQALVPACPQVRVLATSRQPLGMPGEVVLPVLPLSVPDPDRPLSVAESARFAALTLLRERTRARPAPDAPAPGPDVPVEGPEELLATIRVCQELDGLPLAIELATAEPGETERLPDRHRSTAACTRWSYQLCTPAEQLLWQRISVFHHGFDLDAVQAVCGGDDLLWPGTGGSGHPGPGYTEPRYAGSGYPEPGSPGPRYPGPGRPGAAGAGLRYPGTGSAGAGASGGHGPGPDLLALTASLVERSVLIREEYRAGVWYRLLHTVGDFGLQQAAARTGGVAAEPARLVAAAGGPRPGTAVLARRHRDWYLGLVRRGVGDGIGPRRLEWLARLDREHANLAGAVRYSLDHGEPDAAVDLLTGLEEWILGRRRRQGRAWLERALAGQAPSSPRLQARCLLAVLEAEAGDRVSAPATLAPARVTGAPSARDVDLGLLAAADGTVALVAGDPQRALPRYREAADRFADGGPVTWQLRALTGLTLAAALVGDHAAADTAHATALQVADRHGEVWLRGRVLLAHGLAGYLRGDLEPARSVLERSLRVNGHLDDLPGIAGSLAALALLAGQEQDHRRAAVLLGAAENVARTAGVAVAGLPELAGPHRRALDDARRALGETGFRAARQSGRQVGPAEVVALAGLGVPAFGQEVPPPVPADDAELTPRERDVAELIAEGLTNRQIADRLVIAQRTAEDCVDRILAKLGVASRTQVAVWVVRHAGRDTTG